MAKLFPTTIDASYSYDLPMAGNCEVGIPRREITYCMKDEELSLRGPPIAINHPTEYNSLKYRTYDTAMQTMRYGIAGIYNFSTTTWVTDDVTDVKNRSIITFGNSAVTKGDKVVIYYYAMPHVYGGPATGCIQGDELSQEVFDIPIKVWNESVPHHMGKNSLKVTDQKDWVLFEGAQYESATSPSKDTWVTLLSDSTCTKVSGFAYPMFVTEIFVYPNTGSSPPPVPDVLMLRITVDGTVISQSFNDSGTSEGFRFGTIDENSSWYDATNQNPGAAFSIDTDKNALFSGMELAHYSDYGYIISFDFGMLEVLDEIKVEIYYSDASVSFNSVNTRICAWVGVSS